ncbi:FAD-linked oxidoreductase-like protein 18 [Colletotrichum truncatum]|uniref:FAD-linked oxidoreductase-like protein 18 n=1 Tax=Colletotrichum truncatum TaxID=5467 RepID=A0ACC3ZFT2_COLTU|nr:FAD-linked oxidoreductase-like protein 18 [Colletotrichum truncatum]KAF6801889.1 FAD-linked oxidoreductase-like protein 18 [Colletotrichum truncatum]
MQLWKITAGALCALKFVIALDCKCAPGDPCWPSDETWSSLNETLSGRLLKTILAPSVCYKDQPNYDAAACKTVISNWSTPAFHSSDPVSVHSPWFANNSCNPIYENGTSTAGDALAGSRGCSLGKYPAYSVNVSRAEDVQAAVKFAAEHNLRLNVKNTGHNGAKSTAFGSLSIWTHNLKQHEFHKEFVPTCPNGNSSNVSDQMAVTFGAGIQDDEAFKTAAKYGVAVVGGTNADVGLVGWATAGGHGWMTSEYGMGADSIVEATVVTPGGEIVTANECQNSDIFWAVRGGGGGTFGVITELTVKAHPMPQATVWTISVTKTDNSTFKSWWSLVAELHNQLPALKEGGFQGFYTIGGPPSYDSLTFYGFFFLYNKPNGTAEALTKSFLSILEGAASTATHESNVIWSRDWISVYNSLPMAALGGAGGGGGATASRLLPAAPLTNNTQELAKILEAVGPRPEGPVGGISNPTIAGGMIASKVPVDNALNPAWRDAVVHFYVTRGWDDSASYPEVTHVFDDMTNRVGDALRSLAPESGAYINEASLHEPNWQQTFWGRNYVRLQEIKKKLDPESLQWCPRCVGSEDWIELMDGRLCRASSQ